MFDFFNEIHLQGLQGHSQPFGGSTGGATVGGGVGLTVGGGAVTESPPPPQVGHSRGQLSSLNQK